MTNRSKLCNSFLFDRRTIAALAGTLAMPFVLAQSVTPVEAVVVSASRSAQTRFDAPAAIDVIQVDPFTTMSPLVNLSELLGSVPGLQVRERQNFAQDLQISVRGFGTRSTFGVRGVRILVDGIPATMPDGQGQAATANLAAASRIEVLRGPMAQLYGNAAGGVVQIFTKNPPRGAEPMTGSVTAGVGADGQRQLGAAIAGGNDVIGGTFDVSTYSTDGYRDHSAAERTQFSGKVVVRPSAATTITGLVGYFNQPESQDPLGLTRAAFEQNPRQVIPGALLFDTRKTIEQQQVGVVVEHKLGGNDTLNARVYSGTRQVFQTLSFKGDGATQSGGVIDLDRNYAGLGLNWNHTMKVNDLPLSWTLGVEADNLRELRRGFVNNNGTPGALKRDEKDTARNLDFFGQLDWTFSPQWRATAGVRASRVRLGVDDHFGADDSGKVEFNKTSPVAGLVWSVADNINLYANLGKGFETPTLAESAYSTGGAGPNLSLRPSTSTQVELGAKIKSGRHAIDLAVFDARSNDEIVPTQTSNGRSIFQNVDGVQRRGIESSWQARWDNKLTTRVAYTWLDASFRKAYSTSPDTRIAAGNRLPGAPEHSLYTEAAYQWNDAVSAAVEMRAESKVYVNDVNSAAAPGYAVLNARTGYAFKAGAAKLFLFGRIDNLLDKQYAGSVIVNDSNGRFYEAAAGRRLFVGLRVAL
ncbi:TonB-dependent receptor [Actimicrobium sp. CCC2.4]|uniref:TonB-dependent receptor family protein n=1 Tax=Actimicrobium sp. CCC2.4 TaxID=3048606 RepID=UPI002AC9AE5F|nr:TonB-dependent receptor [Actimicrobium sp. CCC2.4]MEB0136624.1 TonB-dependent receptor [Actimicrobium sp. CCC2.4]WPX31690.1 TonB-dependent receptor [Actimicrobium sp. CCC2.4]